MRELARKSDYLNLNKRAVVMIIIIIIIINNNLSNIFPTEPETANYLVFYL